MPKPLSRPRPILFGEVLFDRFPDGSEVLGGAPFNVAWHLRGFGEAPLLISRVGEDDAGRRVREAMVAWGLDTAGLQIDPVHPTGAVRIELVAGEPRFHILPDQAYDFIAPQPLPAMGRPGTLYHGSLALRRAESRLGLESLVDKLGVPIFLDVNLRSPWWGAAAVLAWARRARWVKLNQTELEQLAPDAEGLAERAEALLGQTGPARLIVTRGEAGALALEASGPRLSVGPAGTIPVVDTVGAGDAFAAVCMLGQSRGWSLATILERARDFAAAMVGVRGATVEDRSFYQGFLEAWRPA